MSPSNRQLPGSIGRWIPALAAGLVLVSVVGIGALMGGGGSSSAAEVTTSPPASDVPTVIVADTLTLDTTEPPSAVPPLANPLVLGSSGDDVRRLQERLVELGFQPGTPDGVFGSGTQQAVWAFKKMYNNIAWGDFKQLNDQTTVTDETWQQVMDPATAFTPRRPGPGTHLEVYLPLQTAAVFTDNRPTFISHISSGILNPKGEPDTFCEDATFDTDEYGVPLPEPVTKAICAEAKTPGGVFKMERHVDGKRVSPLGGMKNPWYFNFGIAIHGAYNVPNYPASHGCIRISNSLADVFPTLMSNGDRVFVWGLDGKEPEQYTKNESLPSFNRPDPNATTTTSTTTTTTSTTVPAPATTAPAPATTAPTTTTTTSTTTSTTTTTVAVPLD